MQIGLGAPLPASAAAGKLTLLVQRCVEAYIESVPAFKQGCPMVRRSGWMVLVLLLVLGGMLSRSPVGAETCLSPFVKRLDRPEKVLYCFCVDADAKDNDFLAVVDVDPASPKYSQIIDQLDLGSAGNETHHFGFTDDRTHIWGLSLFSSKVFLIDVGTNPAKPRLVKVLDKIPQQTGFTGPHSAYALPGRMLISFLGGRDGALPTGLAEFTNDGQFIRRFENPSDAPYGYDVAIKPELNRMVTSSFTPLRNYQKPLAQMDMKDFGKELLVWDFRERKVLQRLTAGLAPLECRWSLQPGHDYGFTNCALEDSIWVWEAGKDGKYTTRQLCKTGKLPADLRQSADDKYLFVSCFFSDEIQQWDVSDLKNPRLHSTLKPGKQPNMMHVTSDGQRMYISNSLLSTLDQDGVFWIKLARINDKGMTLDPKFGVDLNKLPTGPARGHDLLLN
jgi:selenium-binding protein 1